MFEGRGNGYAERSNEEGKTRKNPGEWKAIIFVPISKENGDIQDLANVAITQF